MGRGPRDSPPCGNDWGQKRPETGSPKCKESRAGVSGQGSKDSSNLSSVVKNMPAKQEIWVQTLGREDPLEEEMAAHSSILAWSIPWTEEPGGLQSTG